MRTSKTRRVEGKVEEISTWHTPHRSLEDNWNRKYARISIWAHTDQGHQVWLETVRGENGSIGERCREHEARYQHLIGQKADGGAGRHLVPGVDVADGWHAAALGFAQ